MESIRLLESIVLGPKSLHKGSVCLLLLISSNVYALRSSPTNIWLTMVPQFVHTASPPLSLTHGSSQQFSTSGHILTWIKFFS
ncbi:MAG: hypothetical protein ACXACO_21255 [Promethearchaeota archaeon]